MAASFFVATKKEVVLIFFRWPFFSGSRLFQIEHIAKCISAGGQTITNFVVDDSYI